MLGFLAKQWSDALMAFRLDEHCQHCHEMCLTCQALTLTMREAPSLHALTSR